MTALIDMTGDRIGRLTVRERCGTSIHGRVVWDCICECGNEVQVEGKQLRNGHTTSCGCRRKEGLHRTHGMSKTSRLYTIWLGMRARCKNKNAINYKNYGGRGIKVCPRWQKFENFRDDMSWSYHLHMKEHGVTNTTLERVNNNGNYEPKNCTWATRSQQYFNSRNVLTV